MEEFSKRIITISLIIVKIYLQKPYGSVFIILNYFPTLGQ